MTAFVRSYHGQTILSVLIHIGGGGSIGVCFVPFRGGMEQAEQMKQFPQAVPIVPSVPFRGGTEQLLAVYLTMQLTAYKSAICRFLQFHRNVLK